MRPSTAIVFVLVLVLPFSCVLSQAPVLSTTSPNGVSVQYLSNPSSGPALALWTPSGYDWVEWQLLKLQEIDSNGSEVAAAVGFRNLDWRWIPQPNNTFDPTSYAVNLEIPQVNVTPFNSAKPFTCKFLLETYFVSNNLSAQIADNTTSINVYPGQVKWQISVSGWQFQSKTNKLRFGIQLQSWADFVGAPPAPPKNATNSTTTPPISTTTTSFNKTTTTKPTITTTPLTSTTSTPLNGTTSAPFNTTTTAPLNTTTTAPLNGTTTAPLNGTTTSPFNGTTSSPGNQTTSSPSSSTAPINSTTSSPFNVTTTLPSNFTTSSPFNFTTSSPTNSSGGNSTTGVPYTTSAPIFNISAPFTLIRSVSGMNNTAAIIFAQDTANLVAPTVAVIDGNVTYEVNVRVTAFPGILEVDWDFPAFNTSLEYDPILSVTDLLPLSVISPGSNSTNTTTPTTPTPTTPSGNSTAPPQGESSAASRSVGTTAALLILLLVTTFAVYGGYGY